MSVKRGTWNGRVELNPFGPWRVWPLVGVTARENVTQWWLAVLFLSASVTRRVVDVPELSEAK